MATTVHIHWSGVYMDYGCWRLEDLQELEELGLASRLESTHPKGFGTDSALPSTWMWSVRSVYVQWRILGGCTTV